MDSSDDSDDEWINHILNDDTSVDENEEESADTAGLSDVQRNQMRWKEIIPTAQNTKITLNKAANNAWHQAKVEIHHLQNWLVRTCNEQNSCEISDEDIIYQFYGPNGIFTTILMQHLDLSYKEYSLIKVTRYQSDCLFLHCSYPKSSEMAQCTSLNF